MMLSLFKEAFRRDPNKTPPRTGNIPKDMDLEWFGSVRQARSAPPPAPYDIQMQSFPSEIMHEVTSENVAIPAPPRRAKTLPLESVSCRKSGASASENDASLVRSLSLPTPRIFAQKGEIADYLQSLPQRKIDSALQNSGIKSLLLQRNSAKALLFQEMSPERFADFLQNRLQVTVMTEPKEICNSLVQEARTALAERYSPQ